MAPLQDELPVANGNFGSSMALSPSGKYLIAADPERTYNPNIPGNGYVAIFQRNNFNIWMRMKSWGEGSQSYVNRGAQVDISDSLYLIVNGGENKVTCSVIGHWSGYWYDFETPIHGTAIDPVKHEFYVWAAPVIWRRDHIKSKTIATNGLGFGMPRSFAVYNNLYSIGSPVEAGSATPYKGGYYIGSLPAY